MTQQEDSVDRHVALWSARTEGRIDPEVEAAAERVALIARHTDRVHSRIFAEAEISPEDFRTLRALAQGPPPHRSTPARLAETLHLTRAAMTARLDRLASAGLIERRTDPDDRRRVIVEPTSEGLRIWHHHLELGTTAEARIWQALDAEELRTVNRLLRKVVLGIEID